MKNVIRLVDEPAPKQSIEHAQLVDRLAVSMGKLGAQREDVLQLTAEVMLAQQGAFHGACASLNYDEAEMVRRDLRGANNPSLGMLLLRLIERPREMRDALAVMASHAGCRLVVDESPALRVNEAKAELQIAHAELQALIDRAFSDGYLDSGERAAIGNKLVEVSERIGRVNRAIEAVKG